MSKISCPLIVSGNDKRMVIVVTVLVFILFILLVVDDNETNPRERNIVWTMRWEQEMTDKRQAH